METHGESRLLVDLVLTSKYFPFFEVLDAKFRHNLSLIWLSFLENPCPLLKNVCFEGLVMAVKYTFRETIGYQL